jgi:hypothetical protein
MYTKFWLEKQRKKTIQMTRHRWKNNIREDLRVIQQEVLWTGFFTNLVTISVSRTLLCEDYSFYNKGDAAPTLN